MRSFTKIVQCALIPLGVAGGAKYPPLAMPAPGSGVVHATGHMSAAQDTTRDTTRVATPGDTSQIALVELQPVKGQDLASLLAEEIAKARKSNLTPFIHIGATWCEPCQALHKVLTARPVDPGIAREFAGTYTIEMDFDAWGNQSFVSMGVNGGGVAILPAILAIDTTGHVTESINGSMWGDPDPAGLAPLQQFFQAHIWPPAKAQGKRAS